MKPRMVVVTIDTLVEIMKDYLGPEILPTSARPVTLRVNPAEQGKFAVVVESPDLPYSDTAMHVNYRNKRVFGVGS